MDDEFKVALVFLASIVIFEVIFLGAIVLVAISTNPWFLCLWLSLPILTLLADHLGIFRIGRNSNGWRE